MSRRVVGAAAAALVSLLLVLTGCSSSSDSSSGSKTLRVAVDSIGADPLDPIHYVSNPQQTVYSLLFDPLIAKDPDTGKLAPGVATNWDLSGKTWTIKLRDDVKFSDGTQLTSEDVKFTLERYVGISGESTAVSASRMKGYITAVEAPDPTTVTVETTNGGPALPYDLAQNEGTAAGYVVPKAYVEKVGAAEFEKNPIGSGPFVLKSQQVGNSLNFTVNKDYWGTKPSYDALSLQIVGDVTTRLSMLRTGQVDLISGITGPAIQTVLADKTVKSFTVDDSGISLFMVGGQTTPGSPTTKLEVRKAISKAIDRAGIVKTLLQGKGAPTYLYGFEQSLGWPSDASSLVDDFDPAAAKSMLAQAGYPNGFDLTLWAQTTGKDFASAVAQNLEAIGIKVRQQIVDPAALIAEYQSPTGKKDPRLLMVFGPTGQAARQDVSSFLLNNLTPESSYAQPMDNPELVQALKDLGAASDGDARNDLITKVMTLNFEGDHVIAGWTLDTVFATGKNVAWKPVQASQYPQNLQSVTFE